MAKMSELLTGQGAQNCTSADIIAVPIGMYNMYTPLSCVDTQTMCTAVHCDQSKGYSKNQVSEKPSWFLLLTLNRALTRAL